MSRHARDDLDSLLEKLCAGQSRPASAWSISNLLAVPAQPRGRLQIRMVYMNGTDLPEQSSRTASFVLDLPDNALTRSPEATISLLSFSPCGAYLLCVVGLDFQVRHEPPLGAGDLLLVMYEQASGSLNDWNLLWTDRLANFGAAASQKNDSRRSVLSIRWLAEPRRFIPSENTPKPFRLVKERSPAIAGCAFVLVLSTNEITFFRFLPKTSDAPAVPLTASMPLSIPVSHTSALPTPSSVGTGGNYQLDLGSASAHLQGTSPSNAVDHLVANLVNGNMPAATPFPNATSEASPSTNTGTPGANPKSGVSALKEELEAAKRTEHGVKYGKRLSHSAIGVAKDPYHNQKRVGMSIFSCETRMVIATVSAKTRLSKIVKRAASPIKEEAPAVLPSPSKQSPRSGGLDIFNVASNDMIVDAEPQATDLSSIFGTSLTDLDTSFLELPSKSKDDTAKAVPIPDIALQASPGTGPSFANDSSNASDALTYAGEPPGQAVELYELRVELNAMSGPKLMIKHLDPIYLQSHPDEQRPFSMSLLSELTFLESDAGDLRLLVLSQASNEPTGPSSCVSTWDLSIGKFEISEAFSSLEIKKKDVTHTDEPFWNSIFHGRRYFPNLLTFITPYPFGDGLFIAGFRSDTGLSCSVLDSVSLEDAPAYATVALPDQDALYTRAVLSTNGVLACIHGLSLDLQTAPILTLSPTPLRTLSAPYEALAEAAALSFITRTDPSDIINRIHETFYESEETAEDESREERFILDIVTSTRAYLARMLPEKEEMSNSPLQPELLGFQRMLYKAVPSLSERGDIIDSILRLATCERAFRKNARRTSYEKPAEKPDIASYSCDSEALWPLIGIATWYCDFVHDLVRAIVLSPPQEAEANKRKICLFLHPYVRGMMHSVATYILGLQLFLSSFVTGTNFAADTALTALNGVMGYANLSLSEWRSMLSQMDPATPGAVDASHLATAYARLLIDFDPYAAGSVWNERMNHIMGILKSIQFAKTEKSLIEDLLSPAAPSVVDLSNGLAKLYSTMNVQKNQVGPIDMSVYVSVVSQKYQQKVDIIRQCVTDSEKAKICTKCGAKTSRANTNTNTDILPIPANKWAAYEFGWEYRCFCGGAWLSMETPSTKDAD